MEYESPLIKAEAATTWQLIDSFDAPHIKTYGLTFDGVNLWSCSYESGKIYKHDGISATILSSFNATYRRASGLATDGRSLFSSEYNYARLFNYTGFYLPIKLTRIIAPHKPFGITFSGQNILYSIHGTKKFIVYDFLNDTIIKEINPDIGKITGLCLLGQFLVLVTHYHNRVTFMAGVSDVVVDYFALDHTYYSGLTTDGRNLYTANNETNKIEVYSKI